MSDFIQKHPIWSGVIGLCLLVVTISTLAGGSSKTGSESLHNPIADELVKTAQKPTTCDASCAAAIADKQLREETSCSNLQRATEYNQKTIAEGYKVKRSTERLAIITKRRTELSCGAPTKPNQQ